MVYYSALQNEGNPPICENMEDIMPSETKQKQKDKILHDLIYMWNVKGSNSYKQKVEWWLPGARRMGGGNEMLVKGYKISVMQRE